MLVTFQQIVDTNQMDNVVWKLRLLKSGAAYANSCLHAVQAEVLLIARYLFCIRVSHIRLIPSPGWVATSANLISHCIYLDLVALRIFRQVEKQTNCWRHWKIAKLDTLETEVTDYSWYVMSCSDKSFPVASTFSLDWLMRSPNFHAKKRTTTLPLGCTVQ